MNEYLESWKSLNEKTQSFDFNQYAYLHIDDELACTGELSDEEIIQSIDSDDENVVETQDTESLKISKKDACFLLKQLQLFFMQQDVDKMKLLKN